MQGATAVATISSMIPQIDLSVAVGLGGPPRSCHLAPPRLATSLALPAPLTCRPCCRCSLIATARCRPGSPTMTGNPVPFRDLGCG